MSVHKIFVPVKIDNVAVQKAPDAMHAGNAADGLYGQPLIIRNSQMDMKNKEQRFRSIVAENDRKIRGVCRYYAPSDEDQKDMYQEILINIWKSLDKFRGDSQISTWIYRIAVNTSLNYAGKHYKHLRLNVDPATSGLHNMLQDDTGLVAETEEQIEKLQTFLNQLNVIDKAIMGLVLDELSTKEIADIIGITEPNVRVKIHRIKETLRNQMKGGQNE